MHGNSVEKALEDIREGKLVIVFDDQNRENEGDLILAAEKATPEALAFLIRYTSGIICLSMTEERLDQLSIPQMVSDNTDSNRTAFTVSVDCNLQTTTGVSAADRAATIQALIHPKTESHDLRRPGHIFPLKYRKGGVLKRPGHTEAALDLAHMANLYPAGVLAEITNDDGTMARLPDLVKFAAQHQLTLISIEEIIHYRQRQEKLVRCISKAQLPTRYGLFDALVYQSEVNGIEHLALVKGEITHSKNILVRIHSECLTGDVFGSCRCDCGDQLQLSLKKIEEEGAGVVIYLRGHEGRGIGLGHKLKAYSLQEQGYDTVEANLELGFPPDLRQYDIAAQILMDLGIGKLRLLTNNPAKYNGLSGYPLEITERVPLFHLASKENFDYLMAKKNKLGHLIEI